MEFEKLSGNVRTERKKGTARRLRREGNIPAVCYGPKLTPVAISLDPKALSQALAGPLGQNTVIKMSVEGDGAPTEPLFVMLQDYQYHPVDRTILHADFLHVDLDSDVHVQVPLVLTGRSVGVQAGGVMAQVFRTLPITCSPSAIPEKIEIEVTEMEVGDIRKVSDLTLPESVSIAFESSQTLVSVNAPTVAAVVEEEEDELPEGEEEKPAEAPSEEA